MNVARGRRVMCNSCYFVLAGWTRRQFSTALGRVICVAGKSYPTTAGCSRILSYTYARLQSMMFNPLERAKVVEEHFSKTHSVHRTRFREVDLVSFGKVFFNYSAASNNMKVLHWPLMGGLLHLVQQGGVWAGPQPALAPPYCTKCNSPPINGQCTNHRIALRF